MLLPTSLQTLIKELVTSTLYIKCASMNNNIQSFAAPLFASPAIILMEVYYGMHTLSNLIHQNCIRPYYHYLYILYYIKDYIC